MFSPLEYYLSWANRIQRGEFSISFWDFLGRELPRFNPLRLGYPGFSPRWIGVGFHLWFIGFLFFFALIALPIFQWMKSEKGKPLVSKLAGVCKRRGGILVFIIPLLLIQICRSMIGRILFTCWLSSSWDIFCSPMKASLAPCAGTDGFFWG
jgi:hypothetical protein